MLVLAYWLIPLGMMLGAIALVARHINLVHQRDEAWTTLLSMTRWEQTKLSADVLAALPQGAQRFVSQAIPAHLPVPTVVTALTRSPQGACLRILAAPDGGVWRWRAVNMAGRSALDMLVDGNSSRQSWILRVVPCPSNNCANLWENLLIESLLWTPGSIVHGGLVWTDLSNGWAKVRLGNGQGDAIDIELYPDGRVRKIVAPDRILDVVAYQPWDGHMLPTQLVEHRAGLASSITLDAIRYAGSWKDATHC
ncbi:hypothetical protein [Devosia sp. CAU 1758]